MDPYQQNETGFEMAIFGYARVSTEEQVAGQSIGVQIDQVRGMAMIRGEQLAEMFVDEGVSGSTPLADRPAGAALLARAQKGDVIICAKLDRVFRSVRDASNLAAQWREKGIAVILLNIGTEPVNQNGQAEFFFNMMAAVAQFERTQILERTDSGRKAKKAAGGHIGGSAPLGYRVEGEGKAAKLVAEPKMLAAIETAKEARSAGFSLRAAADLASQKHGVKLSHESIRRWERPENAE